jgi:hypothetical protein
MSESLSEAFAAAAISPRTSLDDLLPRPPLNGGGGAGVGREGGPGMPTIDSVGSLAGLTASGSREDINGAAEANGSSCESNGDACGAAGNGLSHASA